jgi:hypothetical protein
MEGWVELLKPEGPIDMSARLIAVVAFFVWNLFEGSLFHTPYPVEWVYLYKFPYWRLFLVVAVIAAASWCPRVGIMSALALFFYLGDLSRLTQPFHVVSAATGEPNPNVG